MAEDKMKGSEPQTDEQTDEQTQTDRLTEAYHTNVAVDAMAEDKTRRAQNHTGLTQNQVLEIA